MEGHFLAFNANEMWIVPLNQWNFVCVAPLQVSAAQSASQTAGKPIIIGQNKQQQQTFRFYVQIVYFETIQGITSWIESRGLQASFLLLLI